MVESLPGHEQTGGLVADRLKAALTFVWMALRASPKPPRGIVFAYDEAQNMADHARKDEYPLSVMLDVFQSIQRQGAPFLLALTGLPTLFPKLVEARTYSERMFRVLFLNRLDPPDVREAIVKPIQEDACPITFTEESIRQIEKHSGGYPYFIQFICHEAFDAPGRSARTHRMRPEPIGRDTRAACRGARGISRGACATPSNTLRPNLSLRACSTWSGNALVPRIGNDNPEGSPAMADILHQLDMEQAREDLPDFAPGDTIRVLYRVREGKKERIQVFEGVCLGRRGSGMGETFTVRKISGGIGVERVFPVNAPTVGGVEVVRRGRVRRAKLYYLRGLRGKAARIKEKRTFRPN